MSNRFRWFLTIVSIFSGVSIASIFFIVSIILIENLCPAKYLSNEITCDMDKATAICTLPWLGELHLIALILYMLIGVALTVLIPVFVAPSHKKNVAITCFLLVACPLAWFGYKNVAG